MPRSSSKRKRTVSLTLKNVPQLLLRRLRATAERERRSINQQALLALDKGLERPRPSFADLARKWRREVGPLEPDLAEAFERLRDRSPGRDFKFE